MPDAAINILPTCRCCGRGRLRAPGKKHTLT
jgi:hypothetical protein